MFLPMSCTSPLTVAIRILPLELLLARCRLACFSCLHERHQVGDRLLHHARRLHHLRQEHLARAEQVADHVHAGHQRAFDHVERPLGLEPRLLGVGLDEIGDAVHQRMRRAACSTGHSRQARSASLLLACRARGSAAASASSRSVASGAAVEHHVLAGLAQLRLEVVVDRHLPGIDDAHVHAGLDGVVEEHRVHRLAHRLVAAERERQVRHAARDMHVRQVLADPARRLDEGDAVAVVLLDAGGDREDVGIEDDVLGREADLVRPGSRRRACRSRSCARACRPGPARRTPSPRRRRRSGARSWRAR